MFVITVYRNAALIFGQQGFVAAVRTLSELAEWLGPGLAGTMVVVEGEFDWEAFLEEERKLGRGL